MFGSFPAHMQGVVDGETMGAFVTAMDGVIGILNSSESSGPLASHTVCTACSEPDLAGAGASACASDCGSGRPQMRRALD